MCEPRHTARAAARSGKFILLFRISSPNNQKRCQKRLPRLTCHEDLLSTAALRSLKWREARGGKQCVNSPFCLPEDKGPLGTLFGGLALLFPDAAIQKNTFRVLRII